MLEMTEFFESIVLIKRPYLKIEWIEYVLEYPGLWEFLNNPDFKGVEFDPLLKGAGRNAFTMSPSRWVELSGAHKERLLKLNARRIKSNDNKRIGWELKLE